MTRFANLRDGGRALASLLEPRLAQWTNPVLAPVLPNGVPVVLGLRAELSLPVVRLDAHRSDEGVDIEPQGAVAGRTVIVIDDGVETGTVARAAAPVLRQRQAARLVLAVPVCPREASAHLELIYDEVLAVQRPLARRSLRWHYDDFDTIDESEALGLLRALPF